MSLEPMPSSASPWTFLPFTLCYYHRHTHYELRWSMDDGATSVEVKKLGTTLVHEDRDEEGDTME